MDAEEKLITDRIKKRRLELGMSYQELADKTGLSKSTLQRYETGAISNIPLGKLKILAKALKTSPLYIIGLESDKNYSVETGKLQNLSPENREKALEYINLLNMLEDKQAIEKENLVDFEKEAWYTKSMY